MEKKSKCCPKCIKHPESDLVCKGYCPCHRIFPSQPNSEEKETCLTCGKPKRVGNVKEVCICHSPKPEVWKCKCGGEMIYEGYKWLCRKCLNEAPKPEEKKPVDLCWCPHCSKGHFCNNPYHRGSTPPTEQSTEKCHCRGEFSHLIGIIHGSDKCFVPVFTPPTPPNTPAWEEEFDEKFVYEISEYMHGKDWDNIKSFISSLLQARDREIRGWIDEARNLPPSTRNHVLDYIINKLELNKE